MTDLTSEQIAALSAEEIKLHEFFKKLGVSGAAVNAVEATAILEVSGVSIDGETVKIGKQTYEFLADTAQTKTLPGNVAIDISDHVGYATQTLTIAAQPTAGDTMTLGTKVYTFVANGSANEDGEVNVGTDLATAKLAIVAAVNGTDGYNVAHPLVSAGAFVVNVSTITALIGGTAANSLATTETFTNVGNVFGGVTLAGGTNCSAVNTASHLIAAINANDTQGVAAAAGTGNNVNLTADVAGVAANAIVLAETMANGAFTGAVTHLTGGVDGSVGVAGQQKADATYLYICSADNTVAGKNWRRIALGSAY